MRDVVLAATFACALLGLGGVADAYTCHPGHYYRGHCYAYRYHGHYYRYRYHGRYYLHRSYRHGHWYYY
jgi:hypothetical protein